MTSLAPGTGQVLAALDAAARRAVIGPRRLDHVATMLRGIKRRAERAASMSKDGSGVAVDLAPASAGADVCR